jgi:hypothetical protein
MARSSREQVPLPDGRPLRREDRDLPRQFWRLLLLGLLALCLLHVAGLAWACVTAGTILPLVDAATGRDNLTTQLLGLVLLALSWITKRQQNRTEALAGRGPVALHAKVDALAEAHDALHTAHDTRTEQLTALAGQVELLAEMLLAGESRRGRHAPTGALPVVAPADGGEPDAGLTFLTARAGATTPSYVPPPAVTWEQITTGDLPPTR